MNGLNRRAALTALAGAAAAVPAISLATPLADPLAGLPGQIAAKTRHVLSALPAAGGDVELFAAIAKYEEMRAAKWAVLAREDYDEREDDADLARDAEYDAFSEIDDIPATTLAGVLAKAIVLLEDFDEPGDDNFGNNTCYGLAVAESLINDLQRLGIEWTPDGHPMTGQRELTDAAEDWIERAIESGHDPVVVIHKPNGIDGLYTLRGKPGCEVEPLEPGSRLFGRVCWQLQARGRWVHAETVTGGAA